MVWIQENQSLTGPKHIQSPPKQVGNLLSFPLVWLTPPVTSMTTMLPLSTTIHYPHGAGGSSEHKHATIGLTWLEISPGVALGLLTKFQPHWPLGMTRSLGIPSSFKTQGLCTCCFLQRMLSAHSYFIAKTHFFKLQLKSLFLRENFQDFSIYQCFQCMTLSLPVWYFPSQQVLGPALPAFNLCLLHDTVLRATGANLLILLFTIETPEPFISS